MVSDPRVLGFHLHGLFRTDGCADAWMNVCIGARAASAVQNEALVNLQTQLREMSSHLEGLEKERDFYFAKV